MGGLCTISSLASFQDFVSSNRLIDLDFSGSLLTWHNEWCEEGYLQERLDRALVFVEWLSLFQKLGSKLSWSQLQIISHLPWRPEETFVVENTDSFLKGTGYKFLNVKLLSLMLGKNNLMGTLGFVWIKNRVMFAKKSWIKRKVVQPTPISVLSIAKRH